MSDAAANFVDLVSTSALGYFRLLSMYLGLRLGLYDELTANPDGLTAAELAAHAGIAERYAREWLEQQATNAILEADVSVDPPRFRLPAGHAEVLLDSDSLSYLGSAVSQMASLRSIVDHVADAFRHGGGVAYELYGDEYIDGQGGANRPTLLTTLPNEWLPAIPAFHDRLTAGPARVFDIGCGVGWSSIGLANAYPHAEIDGFDADLATVEKARRHAADAGIDHRVRFHAIDGASIEGPADLAIAVECIHDMSDPVSVLGAVRNALVDDGAMLIVDERTRDAFDGTPDDLESFFYGYSLFDCLPTAMIADASVGTGTVMRADTLRGYATDAGFSRVDVLPVEHDQFRLYLLRP
jgi:SAM-dependent methyltransferase